LREGDVQAKVATAIRVDKSDIKQTGSLLKEVSQQFTSRQTMFAVTEITRSI